MATSANRPSPGVPAALTVGRRGRPTAERAAAIDAAIRAAARDLFIEAGFEAASMDAIAANARVSKGTLYARYESKAPLFRAILESELEELGNYSSSQDRPRPDCIETLLRRYARRIVEVQTWPQFRRIVALLDRSASSFPDLERAWDEIVTRRAVESLAREMTKIGESGLDWAFYAKLFHSAVVGWRRAEASQRFVSGDETIAFADRVIDVMLASIRSA